MQILHFPTKEMPCPSFLTDDFGNELQVIPGEYCRNKVANQIIINEKSFLGLLSRSQERIE